MKHIGIISALIIISGIIWFVEFRDSGEIVTESGEIIYTGIITSDKVLTGKNVGDVAPQWVLQSFDGDIVSLDDFKGKPVLIDFFADWCPFCHVEFPFIEDSHQKYKDNGLVIIGIHRTDTEGLRKGKEFIAGAGATFLVVQDLKGDVYGAYTSGPAMPISFFIDEFGVIQDKILGPKTSEMLTTGISKILKTE